jgi:GNAT superfamily N-acetyltransferase
MPTNLRIREALAADDVALGDLLVRAFTAQYARKLPEVRLSPERLADLRDQADKRASATIFVAELDGRVVGTVAMYPWGSPRSEAWIPGAADLRFLAVDVEFQGRGLSGPLLEETERCARIWGVPAICLHIRRGAQGVSRLYQSRGYVRDEDGDRDLGPRIFLEAYVLRL